MRRVILILMLCVSLFTTVNGQDIHFSQFMNSPLLTNPANTGFIPDADYRLGANYRNQWASIPVPYKTYSVFGDAQLFRNKFETGWMGIGALLLRDVAGSGNLTSTKGYVSIAYHQELGLSSLLSAGFNVGFANKKVDPASLHFGDQYVWNGKFFEASVPTADNFSASTATYLDLQAGINYAYFPTDKAYINAGFSVLHINTPKETFFVNSDNQIPRRYTAFLNGSFKMSENVILNPNAYASFQAKSREIVAGANAHYNLSGDGEKQLIGGLYYRVGDAAIAMAGFQLKTTQITFTYDATVSSLRSYNGSRGAAELSIIKHGFYNEYFGNKRQSLCPAFGN
ncbi:MAG: PorP/SprF family type IX secretion system membrane protein [Sphingobacteriales bacterium]|nr:PorP/SprF family type IX secretion system membrane protein [Sphingobacteriales bacterium]